MFSAFKIYIPFNNSEYTFKSPQLQHFSLPRDVISHMLNKPISADALQKLYQTCKYFFTKRPIIILSEQSYITENEISANFFHFQERIKLNNNGKTLFWFTYYLYVCNPCLSELKTIYLNSSRILEIHSSTISFFDFNTNSLTYSLAKIYVEFENKQIVKESIDKSIREISKYGENFNVTTYLY